MKLIYIALFGVCGVFSRYYVGLGVGRIITPTFPHATFLINVIGSFLIGVVYVLGVERGAISEDVRIGLMVGYLGGFTTFSSYCLETVRLIENGLIRYAIIYAISSNVLGLASAFFGMSFARR